MHSKFAILLASLLLVNTIYAASVPRGHSRDALIGEWSTVSQIGDLRNPNTGVHVESTYTASAYDFNADGTYTFLIMGSGSIIKGSSVSKGTYELSGDRLLRHQKTESWYPAPNDPSGRKMYKDKSVPQEITVNIEFEGSDVMIVRGQDNSYNKYTRQKKSK